MVERGHLLGGRFETEESVRLVQSLVHIVRVIGTLWRSVKYVLGQPGARANSDKLGRWFKTTHKFMTS